MKFQSQRLADAANCEIGVFAFCVCFLFFCSFLSRFCLTAYLALGLEAYVDRSVLKARDTVVKVAAVIHRAVLPRQTQVAFMHAFRSFGDSFTELVPVHVYSSTVSEQAFWVCRICVVCGLAIG